MAHVEFQFISLRIAGNMVDAPISLDCWRASILFLSAKAGTSFTLDGIPWDFLTADEIRHTNRIELGGLLVDGKPVNIKHDLRISSDTPIDATVLIVKQYYIP